MNEKATYYLILDCIVGKKEDGRYFLFRNDRWLPDTESVIMDRLAGYDPSEPPDSPYRFGNGSVMDEIEEKARQMGFRRVILQTRPIMPDAVALYTKRGYALISNYPPYDRLEGAVCYAKAL